MQENWSPSARLIAAVAGSALAGAGLKRRDALGVGLGVGGALLCARGVTNIELERLIRVGGNRRAVEPNKQIDDVLIETEKIPHDAAANRQGALAGLGSEA